MTGSVLEKFIWMIPFNFPELFHFTTEEIEEVIKLASDGPVFEVPTNLEHLVFYHPF